ncbi:hypothetical protein BGY98DRAFT_881317, partial [Russula aff. rugulosa BPL654]
ARAFFLPGFILLFCAFILSLLVAVSVPNLPTLDIVRCHFTGDTVPRVSTDPESIKEIRFGIWGYCIYDSQTGDRTSVSAGHRYSTQLISASNSVIIGSGSTRGLAVHPFATGATFIALLFSVSSHITLVLFASLLAFIAAFLTLIAFAIDIALYIIVHDKVHRLPDVQVRTNTAPGFWITLTSLLLLLMAGCIGLIGRRRSRMAGATDYLPPQKSGFFSRFRRR